MYPKTLEQILDLGPPTILDNSMRVTACDCWLKHSFERRGYTYSSKPQYFTFGSAWGNALNIWYSPEYSSLPPQDRTTRALEVAHTTFSDNPPLPEFPPDPINNFQNLKNKFSDYVSNYPTEPWEVITPELGWIYPFELRIKYSLAGALDGYIRWSPYGYLELENKTTGMYLSDYFLATYRYSSQITGYSWYGHKIHGPEHAGTLINVITKKPPTKTGKSPQFARLIETRTPQEYQRFEKDWLHFILSMEQVYASGHFPQTTNPINCVGGIGRSPCLFKNLCASGLDLNKINPLNYPNITIRKERFEPWFRSGSEERDIPTSITTHREPVKHFYHRPNRIGGIKMKRR